MVCMPRAGHASCCMAPASARGRWGGFAWPRGDAGPLRPEARSRLRNAHARVPDVCKALLRGMWLESVPVAPKHMLLQTGASVASRSTPGAKCLGGGKLQQKLVFGLIGTRA